MRSLLAVLLAFTFLAPEIGAAQTDSAPAPGVRDSTPVAAAAAKTAPCTAVPDGQVTAGELDAAATKDTAGGCMPGMAMSPEQLKLMQAQMAAMQGNGSAQSAAAIQAIQAQMAQMGTGGEGMPPGTMAMSPEQLKHMQAEMIGKALEPMKQAQAKMAAMEASGDARSTAAMQAMRARMAKMGAGVGMPPGSMTMSPEELIKQMQAKMGADSMPPGMAPGAMRPPGEGGGKALEVSTDLPGDLKKGKTVIRNIDWIPGGGTVSPAGADGFARAMAQIAAAMKQAGGSYRVDLYMDSQSGNIVVRTLGPQRLAAVQASLVEGGATPGADRPQIGNSMKDGDPRLEIVRFK